MINYRRLVQLYENRSPEKGNAELREAVDAEAVNLREIDLGRLFAECYGDSEFFQCRRNPGTYLATSVIERALTEADGAVSSAAFLNITGQIVYSTTLEAYQDEDFVFTKLIPEVATAFLDGEKIAGISRIGDQAKVRNEGDPYALAGVGEDWINTPAVLDRGMIVPVTWEAVFMDRTGLLLDRCAEVGHWLGYEREIRAIDAFIDENTTTHRYRWKGAAPVATYGDNAGAHTWDNLAGTNALVDWTSINAAEQVFNGITDPYTGAPAVWDPKHLVVTKQLEKTALRIIRGTEIRVATPGYATTGSPTQTVAPNPYSSAFELVSSRMLAARTATDTDWYLADVGKVCVCMVAEPLMTIQAPANNPDEFNRRIVVQHRANHRNVYSVRQPRASVRNTVL